MARPRKKVAEEPRIIPAVKGKMTEGKLKKVLAKAVKDLGGVNVSLADPFRVIRLLGSALKLEPYETKRGAEYTRDYLGRILEKLNGKKAK